VASEDSLMMIVYQGNNYQIRVGDLLSVAGVLPSRQVIAGTGLQGGGQLTENVTLSVAPGGINGTLLADTGVTPGVYGSSSTTPVLTIDSTGRVMAASTAVAAGSGTVTSVSASAPAGMLVTGSPIVSSGTLAFDYAIGYSLPTTASQSNWDAAYADRFKWDGGATGLVATTGRTSLGASTLGGNLFTITNPSAVTFPRFNADNTVSALNAADFRTAIGAGAGTVTSVGGTGTVNGLTLTGTVTTAGDLTLGGTLSGIANSALTNSSVTFNGATVALGASGTITAATTAALTIGTGLSGTSFNGSTAVTVAIDSTVATLAGSQTLTNKTLTSPVITTPALTGGSINNAVIGAATPAAATFTSAAMTTGTVSTQPSVGIDLANKTYVDTVAAQSLTYHAPVYVESPNTAGNLNALYNQPGGAGVGVGATLTNNGTKAALVIDGVLMTTTKRVLVYNQTNAFENGVYTVTTVGTPDPGGTNWVLTRATDADTYAPANPNALGQGDAFFVTAGNTGAGELYAMNTIGVIVFGSTAITFVQISASTPYLAGTGLNLNPATTFNISNVGTAGTYGSASAVPVFVTNAQGQVTGVTDTSIAIANTAVSGLGTMSTQAASSVAITGGSVNGTTVGATTASTGAFTTLSASSTVSGTGFSTYLASPPAIGGAAPAAGTFTTLTATSGISGGTF